LGAVVTDWRYWITYEGRIEADSEEDAYRAAMVRHTNVLDVREDGTLRYTPTVEVEAIDNAGN
jgi:hypothetical protein